MKDRPHEKESFSSPTPQNCELSGRKRLQGSNGCTFDSRARSGGGFFRVQVLDRGTSTHRDEGLESRLFLGNTLDLGCYMSCLLTLLFVLRALTFVFGLTSPLVKESHLV